MRIILIRHGDPDYVHDTLTEKGKIEASLLAENVGYLGLENADFYVSPLGRAADTAGYVLRQLGKTAKTLDWLREFPAQIDVNGSPELQKIFPDTKQKDGRFVGRIVWDMVPSYWTEQEEYFDREGWKNSQVARSSDMLPIYESVTRQFDELLAGYGYVREGRHYRVEKENDITIVCFCHLGISCALLAHLWSVSPFILWHSIALAPTSVTELYTEEREQGVAYFRATRLGDISHLRIGGEKPSFAARFCEVYSNEKERH
ncbi:MAG: histidine phosphatase family protein [Lachnospiraceae bacterium]|nr:histidine phosphatase family protein [Lachnospiraceae bacterium]